MGDPSISKEEKRRLKALKRQLSSPEPQPPSESSLPTYSTASTKVTVLCVRFGNKYGREYVERLRSMVAKHLTVDYEFVCLTDDQHPIPGVRSIVQPNANYAKQWWHKVHMFDDKLDISGRIIYVDLDIVIHNTIDKLILNSGNTFFGIRDFNRKFHPNWKYLNSSVMSWIHGTQTFIYTDFIKDKYSAMKLQGDQDWIWKVARDKIAFWPDSWIQSYKWEIRSRDELIMRTGVRGFKTVSSIEPPADCCIAVFHGDPKPQDVTDKFVVDNWR